VALGHGDGLAPVAGLRIFEPCHSTDTSDLFLVALPMPFVVGQSNHPSAMYPSTGSGRTDAVNDYFRQPKLGAEIGGANLATETT